MLTVQLTSRSAWLFAVNMLLITGHSWLTFVQLTQAKAHKEAMLTHVQEVDRQYAAVFRQLQEMHAKWQAAEDDKLKLQQENAALKQMQVKN